MNNFQDLIFLKIFEFVDADIDKISLLLTCKRSFCQINKIGFRCNGGNLDLEQIKSKCRLNSFKPAILASLELKLKCARVEKLRDMERQLSERMDSLTSKLNAYATSSHAAAPAPAHITPPSPVVWDLLALSSNPAFQASPSAARNYNDTINSLRDLKKRVSNAGDADRRLLPTPNMLNIDSSINPSTASFIVADDDQSLADIPVGTTHLSFGSRFDRFISPGSLPATLTHLTFGYMFNQAILPGTIPASVTNLTFGYLFNRALPDGVIPDTVTHIIMGREFNHPVLHLPRNLQSLALKSEYNQPIKPGWLPANLKNLHLQSTAPAEPLQPGSLPNSLETLEFSMNYNQPFAKDVLPNSLKQLILGGCYNHPLVHLPTSLKTLTIPFTDANNTNNSMLMIPFESLHHLTTITLHQHTIRLRHIDNNTVFILNSQFMGGYLTNNNNNNNDDSFNFVQIAKSLIGNQPANGKSNNNNLIL